MSLPTVTPVAFERLNQPRAVVRAADMKQLGTSADDQWLLAAALLDSLADDLGLCLAAGLWKDHPSEMRGKWDGLGHTLLKEWESDEVDDLSGIVRDGTAGKVRCERGWILRMARAKARKIKGRPSLDLVRLKIRLPLARECGNAKLDTVAKPTIAGRLNPAYQRERARARIAAGLCRDCPTKLRTDEGSRCHACRADHARRMRESASTPVFVPPPGAVPFLTWAMEQGVKLGKSIKSIRLYVKAGKLRPRIIAANSRSWWVLGEEVTA